MASAGSVIVADDAGGQSATGAGWVTHIERLWILPPFRKQLAKRERERVLLDNLDQCVDQLYRNPTSPGLNLETISTVNGRPILSARIARGPRVILTPLAKTEVGLLYFDQHEEAYRWVDRNRSNVPRMLSKVAEVQPGTSVRVAPVAFPSEDEETPIAIASAEQFSAMVRQGIARYMTWLDEEQQTLVDMQPRGLLLVKGGAGTGKTAVAIHRLLKLADRAPLTGPTKVLYLCYNQVLAQTVGQLVQALRPGQVPAALEVRTFHAWCRELLQDAGLPEPVVKPDLCRREMARAFGHAPPEHRLALARLDNEWVTEEIEQVILHNGLETKEQYLQINRRGRGASIKQPTREAVWAIHERTQASLSERGIYRHADLPLLVLRTISGGTPPAESQQYRAIVVDEGQDFSPVMVRVARAMLGEGGLLTVLADPAQTIYENGWQWTQAELRPKNGVSRILRKNYRTTREIYALTRPLLDDEVELAEDLNEMETPLRRGPRPVLLEAATEASLRDAFVKRLSETTKEWEPNQIAVLAPTRSLVETLQDAISSAGILCRVISGRDRSTSIESPGVKVTTYHSAKGLDFPVVFVWGPHRQDLGGRRREVLPETRHVLYVALTRAGASLTIAAISGQQHALLQQLDDECYERVRESSAPSHATPTDPNASPITAGVEDWSWLETARADVADVEEAHK